MPSAFSCDRATGDERSRKLIKVERDSAGTAAAASRGVFGTLPHFFFKGEPHPENHHLSI
jgi:2-hydroxychromene-2-carboxylate isomerase